MVRAPRPGAYLAPGIIAAVHSGCRRWS